MIDIEKAKGFNRGAAVIVGAGKLVSRYDLCERPRLEYDRPLLLAANHRSLLDFPLALAALRSYGVTCRVMIRASYVQNGLGGMILRSMGCIATSRELRQEAESEAVEALVAGELVCMMPEGRIVDADERVNGVGEVRYGLSRIARAANALVLPIGLSQTEKVWPKHGKPKFGKRQRVAVDVGEPIELPGDDHEVNMALVMDAISSLIEDR